MKGSAFFQAISTRVMLVVTVVVLLMASVMLLIGAWSKQKLQEEVGRALLSQNQYFQHILGRDLEQISRRQAEIMHGEPLKRLVFLPSFLSAREIQYNVQWLTREMAVLKDFSPLVQDARIYVQDEDNPIYRTYPSLFTLDTALPKRFAAAEGISRAYLAIDGSFHFTMSYPIDRSLEWVDYLLDIVLSGEAIQATLDQLYMGQHGLVLLADASLAWYVGNQAFVSAGIAPQQSWLEAGDAPCTVLVQDTPYLMYREQFEGQGLTLFALYPERSMAENLSAYTLWYWVTVALAVFALVLIGIYMRRQLHRPMRTLIRAFASVGRGELDVRLTHDGRDEFADLYGSFNTTVAQLRQSIADTYAYRLYAREAELKQLQSQINPHFLYNCFFVLYNMAQVEDMDSVMHMTQYLGQYYQYVFDAEKGAVSLAEDFQQAMRYVQIQIMRFGDRFCVHADDIPEPFGALPIPRLIFQPLVENIFVHGFRKNPGGDLYISFTPRDGGLEIRIEDNGTGMTPEALEALKQTLAHERLEASDGSGIQNVNRRLVLFYGEESRLHLAPSPHGGLSVRFVIRG